MEDKHKVVLSVAIIAASVIVGIYSKNHERMFSSGIVLCVLLWVFG